MKVINYLYISNRDIIIDKIKSLSDNPDYSKYLDYLLDINNLKNISSGNDVNSQYEDYMDDVVRGKLLPLIFTEDKDFILNSKSEENNIIKLIDNFNNIVINDITIKSFSTISIYEYFNSGYEGKSKNKKLGQFFTPKKIINSILYGCNFKNMIMELSDPTIYDPCCGTAGLLCTLYNNCSNINTNNIYGCEISKDTIKYAIASLMLSTNSLFQNLNKGCALSNNKYIFENKKFDVIFTNPPFGTSLNYKDLKNKFDKNKPENFNIKFEDIYPINCNNGVNLFLMNIIYSLNDNGVCAVIVPDGELIYSKSLSNMRKYIIDNCKMLKIISIESKAFEYTQIKTNVLIFKKQKGEDNYKNVEFLEMNKDCNQVKLIAVADLDKYYTFKLETNNNDIIDYELNKDIEIKTLGEVCTFKNGTSITKDKLINGEYPVIGGGQKPLGYHNEYNVIENTILISKDGAYAGYISKYNSKIFVSNHGIYIDTINDIILKDYIYYYLKSIQNKIYTLQLGAGQPGIKKEQIELLEILIPSIEKQEEIVKYLDGLENRNLLFEYSNNRLFELLLNKTDIYDRIELFNNIENINIDINNNINKLNELNNYKLKIVKYNPTTEIKTLGEVSIIHNGKRIVKNKVDTGEYPVLGGGGFTSFYTNEYSRDGKSCKISREGMSLHNCVMILNQKYYLNSQAFTIISNNDKLINNYLWYYLDSIKEIIYNCGRGAAQKAIDIDEFKLIKIPIPSIEVQEEIIDYCDNNLEIINNLKKTIENNKKMMKELF